MSSSASTDHAPRSSGDLVRDMASTASLTRSFSWGGLTAIRVLLPATGLISLAAAVVLLWIGSPPTVLAPWDVVIHLDESWRIFTGQIPHRDFHNPVGSFTYYLSALGMDLVGPRVLGVVVGNVIFLVLASSLASFVAYRRLTPIHAFVFTIFIILLSSALSQIGRPADLTGYVEVYNRYGWTLACILFLQAFFPLRPDVAPRSVLEGVLTGVVLSLIVFTKATFGVLCAIALILALFARSSWRDRGFMVALIVSGLASIVAMYMLAGANIFDYAADVLTAGAAQSLGRRLGTVRETLKGCAIPVALLAATWTLAVIVPAVKGALNWAHALRITMVAIVIGGLALLIAFGNTGEHGEIPLFVVLGLYMLNEATLLGPKRTGTYGREWTYIAATAIVWVGIAGPTMLRDATSIRIGYESRGYAADLAPDQLFNSPSMRDFVIRHDTKWVTEYWKTAQLPARVNEGLEMMRREVGPGATILTLSFSNPFPFALELPAPRGTPVWFDYGLNFTEETHPDALKLFADVAYVAIPIIRDTDGYVGGRKTTETLQEIYGPFLKDHYEEVGHSTYWILLKRRDLLSPAQTNRQNSG